MWPTRFSMAIWPGYTRGVVAPPPGVGPLACLARPCPGQRHGDALFLMKLLPRVMSCFSEASNRLPACLRTESGSRSLGKIFALPSVSHALAGLLCYYYCYYFWFIYFTSNRIMISSDHIFCGDLRFRSIPFFWISCPKAGRRRGGGRENSSPPFLPSLGAPSGQRVPRGMLPGPCFPSPLFPDGKLPSFEKS